MRKELFDFLETLGIAYQSLAHDPITTMREGSAIARQLHIPSVKNLFLVNTHKEYFLLLLPESKKLPASSIARQTESTRLSFASRQDMERLLSTDPGATSVLGLFYDVRNQVRLLIDKDILKAEYIGCHPCENTCSLKIKLRDILEVFLPAIHHADFLPVDVGDAAKK